MDAGDGVVGAGAGSMDGARPDFLSGAAFAFDQDGGARGRHAIDELTHAADGRADAMQAVRRFGQLGRELEVEAGHFVLREQPDAVVEAVVARIEGT